MKGGVVAQPHSLLDLLDLDRSTKEYRFSGVGFRGQLPLDFCPRIFIPYQVLTSALVRATSLKPQLHARPLDALQRMGQMILRHGIPIKPCLSQTFFPLNEVPSGSSAT
jgi:hypothetical protein